ncbi:hypothetical protein GS421_04200 [Rhodococcus hoagii]|nr:hypothetical protein [Prescottella equi]
MLFALAMERVEFRLRRLTVREQEVEESSTRASQSEVATLASEGFPHGAGPLNRRRRAATTVTRTCPPARAS